jgi:diacylglycerol kinase family enzyme
MEKIDGAKRKIKQIMHVLNPLAGKGRAVQIKDTLDAESKVYMSSSCEDANDFIIKACKENPDTCFTVYGGDGTVFRAVNALMNSGCADSASLKIVPVGSGNDFVRSFEGEKGEIPVDVMAFNGRYAINVVNVGFDCEVVRRAAVLKKKPMVSGKMAYMLGVAAELAQKQPIDAKITLTYADGTQEIIEEKILLAAVCNGRWYGGGFQLAPDADLSDGILNVEIIRDISRSKFVSMVADYKKGTHIDVEKGELKENFKEIVYYKKCVAVKIEGVKSVCADGEIFEENTVDVKVIPKAINYIID